MSEKKHIYERELNLWQYKMPKDSLSNTDIELANACNIAVFRTLEADYLVGSWSDIKSYFDRYLDYIENKVYLTPLYAMNKEY